jgi:NitT/TauT family transport system substrate-binding protein
MMAADDVGWLERGKSRQNLDDVRMRQSASMSEEGFRPSAPQKGVHAVRAQPMLGGLSAAALLLCLASVAQAADKVVAAGNRLSAIAPLYIAIEKGLFAAEGLEASLVHLTSATEIGAGIASGSAQFGMTAFSAGIYTLAGKGGLKVIAGGYEEYPGFHGVALVVNKSAYDRGLKRPSDLPGKKVAITTVGSGSHNQLARLAKKHGFRFEDIQIVPLQTLANEVSAVKGGQVDVSPLPATLAQQVEASGAGKIIAWMGDEVPTQFGGLFASPVTIANHRDLTVRFVRAYRRAIVMYDRAFQHNGADGKPAKGEGYDELIDIIAARTGEGRESLARALPYFNPEARLQIEDIAEQIAVYKSLRLVDQSLQVDAVVDRSFLPPGKK